MSATTDCCRNGPSSASWVMQSSTAYICFKRPETTVLHSPLSILTSIAMNRNAKVDDEEGKGNDGEGDGRADPSAELTSAQFTIMPTTEPGCASWSKEGERNQTNEILQSAPSLPPKGFSLASLFLSTTRSFSHTLFYLFFSLIFFFSPSKYIHIVHCTFIFIYVLIQTIRALYI